MKSTAKILFGGLFVGVLLLACHTSSPNKGKTTTSSADSAYISFSLDCPQGVLRDGSEDPIHQVRCLSLYIFDGDKPESKLFGIKKLEGNMASPTPIKLVRRECYILSFVNLTEMLEKKLQGYTQLKDFRDAIKGDISYLADVDGSRIHSIAMSPVSSAPCHVTEDQFSETIEGLVGKTPCKLEVEPMLARVFAYGTPRVANSEVLLLDEEIGFRTIYFSQGFDLIRRTKLEGEEQPLAKDYAYSPGYEALRDQAPGSMTAEFIGKYRVAPNPVLFYAPVGKERNSADLSDKKLYVKETTCPPNHFLVSLIPHIVVRAKVVPKSLKDQLGTEEGWIRYKGGAMRESAFASLVQEVLKNIDAYDKPVNGMPSGFLEALKQGLKDSKKKGLITARKASFTINEIQFYHQSYNYYLLPIRHFGQTEAPLWNSFGRYGVVRNNEYAIHLNTILGFGSNLFPDKLTTDRIAEKSSLSFTLTVKELSSHTIEADLE
ncbi:Mfa1 fimbrilin C-terminal domain-containing protein [Porphyromonas endodontalis]|uniref:Mfa1 fimbrilin C-terminal domain-containing protein n=1 Tax=Porphyromonas endodontalis TaxID=28124 RepID=UPI00287FFC76|nr:Mfa1 fimbrilin C-terminal domain-containing protein [Porphyromonas endodontalis]